MGKCPELASCTNKIVRKYYTLLCIEDYKECPIWKIKSQLLKTPKEWKSVYEKEE